MAINTISLETSVRTGRLRAAWRAAHAPVAGVPRWAPIAAYTISFAVLPSALWRIVAVALGEGDARSNGQMPDWLPVDAYVLFLSALSELLAFTAFGLVASWGEVFPRWLPGLRGRKVPTLAAVIPATIGAVIITALCVMVIVTTFTGTTVQGESVPSDFPGNASHGWSSYVFYACYAPLLLWGPLLGLLTVGYWKRRVRASRQSVASFSS
ncbi:MAG: hypothetical protein HOQ05_11195 [Corynebacteriales bacterium]|nr:hypothetical protein [Mycobacteriales bacterium]